MTKKKEEELVEDIKTEITETEQASEKIEETLDTTTTKNLEAEIKPEEKTEQEEAKPEEKANKKAEKSKYKVGDVVFVAKEASADLAGFKLFPQYKKYTYTVEAFDAKTEIYTLRRLNLTLKLKENDIISPSERAENPLARKQF